MSDEDKDENELGLTPMAKARLQRMESVADGADEKRTKEGDFSDLEGNPVREEPQEEQEPEPEDEPRREPEGEEPSWYDTKHKLKVNGRDVELTGKEIMERAQKVESADEYLRNAADAVKRAIEAPAPSAQDEPATREEDPRELARRLQMGSEEEAAEVISHLLHRPSVTPDDVRKMTRETLAVDSERNRLESEYKDLFENPQLRKLFQVNLNELAQQNPKMLMAEAYQQIGSELRTAFGKPETSTQETKLARKASVRPVPSAASRQAGPPDDDTEEPVDQVIAKMAKARKQERPIVHPGPGGRQG